MGLTSKDTLREVQKLVDNCFLGNSVLDNIVYQMAILPINMPKFYNFTHQILSHALPIKFADAITDFMIERDDRMFRGALATSDKTYDNTIDCYEDIVKVFNEIRIQTEICIDKATENGDKAVEDFLRDFNVKVVTLYCKQVGILFQALKDYDSMGMLAKFNVDFESYIILE